jgi:hypothetical protein
MDSSLTKLCKDWTNKEKEKVREMNLLKAKLNKPDLNGFVAINLRTGKTRKVKQGEFRPLVIDYSDPSLEDGDLVLPDKKEVRKHVNKK